MLVSIIKESDGLSELTYDICVQDTLFSRFIELLDGFYFFQHLLRNVALAVEFFEPSQLSTTICGPTWSGSENSTLLVYFKYLPT